MSFNVELQQSMPTTSPLAALVVVAAAAAALLLLLLQTKTTAPLARAQARLEACSRC